MAAPYYVLAAAIPPNNRVKGFYQEGATSPARLLDSAQRFRYAGFDVTTGDYSKLVEDHWQVESGDRKLLQLYQDGTLLFRMRADAEFLGWGGQNFSWLGWVNPVAVVESHTSFVHLYAAVIPKLLKAPSEVRFVLRFEGGIVNGSRLALTKYYELGIQNVHNPQRYPIHDPNAEAEVIRPGTEIQETPNRVAYVILEKFYELFDADAELIPFTTGVGAARQIDVTAIQNIR